MGVLDSQLSVKFRSFLSFQLKFESFLSFQLILTDLSYFPFSFAFPVLYLSNIVRLISRTVSSSIQ